MNCSIVIRRLETVVPVPVPVPVCAITASEVPGGTLVSMNRFSTLCG
jgi:hypothetical protein